VPAIEETDQGTGSRAIAKAAAKRLHSAYTARCLQERESRNALVYKKRGKPEKFATTTFKRPRSQLDLFSEN
jgi:hypothetical protein